MVRLSQLDRGRAIALILQGRSQRDVAQQFGVHEATISGDNECIDVLVSDILTLAYEKSTDLGEWGP